MSDTKLNYSFISILITSTLCLNLLKLLIFFWLAIVCIYYLKLRFTIPFGTNSWPSALVILGSGGHTWEMFTVLSRLEWQRYLPIYVVANSDQYTLCDLNWFEKNYKRNYFIERLTRPREHSHTSILSPVVLYRSFYCFMESLFLICRYKPDYIISNGPSLCVPPTIAASFLRKLGFVNTKIVYIEGAARVNTLSISAKFVKRFVDYMFAFWPQLCDSHNLLPLCSSQLRDHFLNNNTNSFYRGNESINTYRRKTVLVTVGTTQFTELVNATLSRKFKTLLINKGFTDLTVQIGSLQLYENIEQTNSISQLQVQIIKMLPSHKLSDLLEQADLVISHGGAATILQALTYGKKIVVVPNQKLRQNHQLELVNGLSQSDYIHVSTVENLFNFVSQNYEQVIKSYLPEFKLSLSDSFKKAVGETQLKQENVVYKRIANQSKFSIVIPSTINDIGYLKNLLLSLQRFLSLSSVSIVLIIVPNNHFDKMARFLPIGKRFWKNKIRLIKETDLIPETALSECNSFPKWRSGWFKQQVLKLSAAFYVETDFYLILDSDCILTRPLEYSDLIHESANEIRSYYQTENIYLHQNWWRGSAKLLGMNSSFLNSLKDGIGVTPQVLSVQIVRDLCRFLEKCHPNRGKWYSILCSFRLQFYPTAIWTEYTLYYLFATKTGVLDKYHILKRNAMSNYNHCVWQLHQSYDWNPFIKTCSSPSFFTIFQSNTKLSHRTAAAFLSQYFEENSNHSISCVMLLENNNLDINENMIGSSIECFRRQSWPLSHRELIIVCEKENELLIKDLLKSLSLNEQIKLIVAGKFNAIEKSLETAIGSYIAFWPSRLWSSPYRLSVQFEYIKDLGIDSCYISPFISGHPIEKRFYITEESNIKFDSRLHEMSLFCKREFLSTEKASYESKPLNEPTLIIRINNSKYQKVNYNSDAARKLQPIDSASHLNELTRMTGPFIASPLSFTKRKHTKIYFISSELAFSPVIGGINTFLRVIISQLRNLTTHLDNNIEFVFCGIQCGDEESQVPEIKGLSFKFFQTENSRKVSNLEKYFKSFPKFSSTINDMQKFGHLVMSWIISDSIPGDICVTTIVYECDDRLLTDLVLRGIKLVHTVHSLVPLKIMFNCRCIPFKRLNLKDAIRALMINLFKLNEYKLVTISNFPFLRWILPQFIAESIQKEKLLMSLSQAVFVPSKKLAKITTSLYPSIKHKVRYVPWGLPEGAVIGDPSIDFEPIRLISDSTPIKCLALCKLVPQKGVDLLLDAFNYIEKMDPNLASRLQLNICGDMSYMEENQFFSILKKKVDDLKRVKVKFNGWLTDQSKLDQLREANFFVSPSLTEPFGFSLLEAMKAGLPVVSFATEGPEDIVSPEFGRLVSISKSFDAMAKDFAIAVIDLCYSKSYNKMREESNRTANRWRLDVFFENLFSIL